MMRVGFKRCCMHVRKTKWIVIVFAVAVLLIMFRNVAKADELAGNDALRGKLLYSLHCISCHNEQVHWLAHKKAYDWPGLKAQVKLWQGVLNLKWDDKDISNVAVHLNNLYYHYPAPNTLVQKK